MKHQGHAIYEIDRGFVTMDAFDIVSRYSETLGDEEVKKAIGRVLAAVHSARFILEEFEGGCGEGRDHLAIHSGLPRGVIEAGMNNIFR